MPRSCLPVPSQLGVLYKLALLSSKRRFETLLDKKIEGVAITAPIIEGNGCEPHKISTC